MYRCLSWKTDHCGRSVLSGNRRIYSLRRGGEYLATLTFVQDFRVSPAKLLFLGAFRCRQDW